MAVLLSYSYREWFATHHRDDCGVVIRNRTAPYSHAMHHTDEEYRTWAVKRMKQGLPPPLDTDHTCLGVRA